MPNSYPLVTLQPVCDGRKAWVALLLSAAPPARVDDLARVFGEFGLRDALAHLPCIIVTEDLDFAPETLPGDKIILCPPVAHCTAPASFPRLEELRQAGFRFMASGLPQSDDTLFEGVTGLALPCPGKGAPNGMGAWLGRLPGPHLALGAEQVSCPGRCHFSWFAGQFDAHTSGTGGDAPNRALLLDLLAKVTSDADSNIIEAVIKRDPQLSYHLLKLVNSVGFALTTKIASFGQAITLLGRRQLQRWLQLLLYARSRKEESANPLLPLAAFRAGLLESLCQLSGGTREDQDRAFMIGMFSLLDRLFGMPLVEVLKPLNLAEEVVNALVARQGSLGTMLRAIEAGEALPNDTLSSALADAGVSTENWARALAHASQWAIQVSTEA